MLDTAPISVRFTITDQDIDSLRNYRPGRMRASELERSVFGAILVPDLMVAVAWYFLAENYPRTMIGLAMFAALWTNRPRAWTNPVLEFAPSLPLALSPSFSTARIFP